jgi:hypothetical protein
MRDLPVASVVSLVGLLLLNGCAKDASLTQFDAATEIAHEPAQSQISARFRCD